MITIMMMMIRISILSMNKRIGRIYICLKILTLSLLVLSYKEVRK